jgi:hypothetical protein
LKTSVFLNNTKGAGSPAGSYHINSGGDTMEQLNQFKKMVKELDNKELLKRYTQGKADERENLFKTAWRKENLPYLEVIEAEVMRRMEGK